VKHFAAVWIVRNYNNETLDNYNKSCQTTTTTTITIATEESLLKNDDGEPNIYVSLPTK